MEIYVPKTLHHLPVLVVVPNGSPDTYRVRPVDQDQWQEKPARAIEAYYRLATEDEQRQLLPEAA